MACKTVCRLCKNLIISEAVTYDGTSLVVNLPAGSYADGCKYCIVIAQTIPATTTITAPVVVTIGAGTVQYPLVNGCCAQVTACGVRTRTKYSTIVTTNATGGTFKMLGKPCCTPNNALAALDGGAAA